MKINAPHEVRIIGGVWRGKKIPVAKDVDALRPTPNRIRETLFNWLMHDIHESHCLDAFAGTGALGFEALSRGAATVTFCENAKPASLSLKKNATSLKCADQTIIISNDFLKTRFSQKFDIIFLDPPFYKNLIPLCLAHIENLMHENSLVYVETEKEFKLETQLEVKKAKTAGQVNYYLLK